MAKVYSLTTVSVIITNEIFGQITIGGPGKLVGSVKYDYDGDAFSIDTTPDGGYVTNYNNSKCGWVEIDIKQTSSHIAELTDFINWCRSNPSNAASTIKITDALGNIACSGAGAYPSKIPGNTVGESASDRTFRFIVGELNSEETGI